ncbi:SNAP25 -like proteinous protein SNAP33 [Capsicum baccatum]|uniref:SNAP25-like proteinous protein SNAP33 n=1 Tax=Capsicum baccatum TaxID=33114 RepID=A0A2G2WM17_CAPBA|nr:SNAP25 -like proteinous protein SNAP33 [Capsicum baccatum]PHU15395.1 SNAP25 -like proteinous protein SNAP33 [Capsicum chinense]
MHGLKKSPLHWNARKKSADPVVHSNPGLNPFDSDDESDMKQTVKPSSRTPPQPSAANPNLSANLFDDDEIKETPSHAYSTSTARNKYKNDFRESGGFENQSVEELENYAVYRSEETTKSVNNCLKIAEDMREDATKTLITLHQQGEQITRTHMTAADIDHDLSRGEKLLGSLGGIFSKTWKPKTNRPITGPVITRGSDNPVQRRGNHLEQREKLGLNSAPKARSSSRTPPPEPTNALQKVEAEKAKQDDGLEDLSILLGELKNMAVDMGSEVERHKEALDHVEDDVDELGSRVKGANHRIRRLLGK